MEEEVKTLLRTAMHEIRHLERDNKILQAKVETMDTLAAFLFVAPPCRSATYKEDVACTIEKHLNKL